MKLGTVDPIRNIEDLETVSFFSILVSKSKHGPFWRMFRGQFYLYHTEMHKCKDPPLGSDYGPNYCTPLVIETFLNISDFKKIKSNLI